MGSDCSHSRSDVYTAGGWASRVGAGLIAADLLKGRAGLTAGGQL